MQQPSDDVLRTPAAGALVIRGGALRVGGYALGIVLGAATSVFLLRGLGVDDFGRYVTVTALLALVSTLSDAGLTAVASRELPLRPPAERDALMRDLIALRIGLTLVGIAAAVVFSLVAGYDRVMVEGVVLGGIGLLLVNTQSTSMLPLSVALRIGRITAVDLVRNVVTLAGVAALALAGASLLPYFAVQVLAGIVVVALTPLLVGSFSALRPRVNRQSALVLLRTAAPVGVALAMNVLYLRLLVVMVSLMEGAEETGLYGTAFRIVELFVTLPPVVVAVAIPLLAVAGAEDHSRLRYGLQRLVDVALVSSLFLALVVFVLAEPAIRLLGGEAFTGASTMLQIQVWALVPLAVGNALSVGLLSLHRQGAIALANGAAVVVVLAAGLVLIGRHGGEGAAVAGVLAETALVLALLVFLVRAAPDIVPGAGDVWRPLVALAAGLATLLVPLPPWVDGLVAGAVFVAAAFAVGAVPSEVVDALLRRAPGDRA